MTENMATMVIKEIIHVRRCCIDDMYETWAWWNDPVTRAMMERKSYVLLEEHEKWFNSVLSDTKRVLCIGLLNEYKIGVIRFDAKDEGMLRWEVSINLNPTFRGRKLGWKFLVSAVEFFSAEIDYFTLFANVGESSNVASQRTFLNAGFKSRPDPKYQYHFEYIK